MFILKVFRGIFRVEALYDKIMYTLFALLIFRFGHRVPIPGIDLDALNVLRESFSSTGFLGHLNMMSGGMLASCSIFALGISPYITASIMMQILTISVPYLEALQKEGEGGRTIIKRYTRYFAVLISFFHGAVFIGGMERGVFGGINLILSPGWPFRIKTLFLLAVGALFVMWMGEQISRFGIGNGSSILMFVGIISQIPQSLTRQAMSYFDGELSVFVLAFMLFLIMSLSVCIIFLERGERRVIVYYAKKMVGRASQSFSGATSYIPFKINSAGVMPVILTGPMLGMFIGAFDFFVRNYAAGSFLDGLFVQNSIPYNILMLLLIIWFNFAFMSVIFNPIELADNLRKSGGFLPGIRPGAQTAIYFEHLLTRIGIPGALYVASLAIVPGLLVAGLSLPYMFSGLSLLICVGVALDISTQVESYFIDNRYESFFSSNQ